mmetsp:Transcript_13418/g.51177  ORF Transcript_13418/g.51177 Transcript_13418/m.51177 type:complete len:205 (+) Transcript_13418:134-748(+)
MRAEPGRGLDDGEDDAEDSRPVHHPQGPRPHPAALPLRAPGPGPPHPRRRHAVRHRQDRRHGPEQGALREAPAAAGGTRGRDAQGSRAADRDLYPGAGKHRGPHGALEGPQGCPPRDRGLHGQHPPRLPREGADDQAGAREGPEAQGGVVGPLPAKVQDEERPQEAPLGPRRRQGRGQGRRRLHTLSARQPHCALQAGQGHRER